MYNIANHYENIYQYLSTIIADPTVIYLHPFGSTQPENIETLRNDLDPPDRRDPPERRGPVFIFYDQEPLNYKFNYPLFDCIKNSSKGPFILINTEKNSAEKDRICEHFGFAHLDYFFHIFAAADWYRGHQYLPGIVEPKDRTLNKTFITFNRLTSNERVYRSIFVGKLAKQGLLEHGHISYSDVCPDNNLDYVSNLTATELVSQSVINETVTSLKNVTMPLRIDFADKQHIPNQSMLLSPLPQLMESFVFVVTETCYWQNKTHLTEKIFKPIVLCMPFILVGCANNLEYLRSYGFKTFGDYWDESYDSIVDPIERLDAVTRVLASIAALSADEQKAMLLDMQPILEHNYKIFNDPDFILREWQHLTDSLKDICQYYRYEPPYTLDLKTGQALPLK
jgi:hypothetical protein